MTEARLRSFARTTGTVYLAYFVVAVSGFFPIQRQMIPVIAAAYLSDVLYATTTLLLYRLFRPGDAVLALAATALSLLGCTTDVLDYIHRAPAWLSPLLFFGLFCILLGLLILRSRFLPRLLGWPLIVAGVGWLAYLNPAVALHAKVVIFPFGFLAEFALMLWLLIKGVDETRWVAAASINRAPSRE